MMSVLVIDDDPMILKVARFILVDAGYEVATSPTLEAAWDYVQEKDPDLIILDIAMPDGDGFEFCDRLKRDGFKVPVIVLSGKGDMSTKLQGLELGADDYIVKPFEPAELLARVKAVLRRFKASRSLVSRTVVNAGGIELNTGELKVTLANRKVINLTPTEMKILHCLMENAGHVVSRDSLLGEIWEWGREGARSEISVYVSRLRKKIEPNPAHPRYIQVVRGVGYRFAHK